MDFLELRRLDRRVDKTKAMVVFVEWCSGCGTGADFRRLSLGRKAIKP